MTGRACELLQHVMLKAYTAVCSCCQAISSIVLCSGCKSPQHGRIDTDHNLVSHVPGCCQSSSNRHSTQCNRQVTILSFELVGCHSNSSSRHNRACCLATKRTAHTATAGGATALWQAQHHCCALHDAVGTLAAGPHLQAKAHDTLGIILHSILGAT